MQRTHVGTHTSLNRRTTQLSQPNPTGRNIRAVVSSSTHTRRASIITIALTAIVASLLILPAFWILPYTKLPDDYYEFLMQHAPYVYIIPGEGPDPDWGRAAFSAAFAIDALHETYHSPQSTPLQKAAIYRKIEDLAEFVLTQQFVSNNSKIYQGGFRSNETSCYFYSIDAARIIPSLIRAHKLTGRHSYLDAAKLAGSEFLYRMQHPPMPEVIDRYYGGFVRGVCVPTKEPFDAELWLTQMDTENLYALIGLNMLIEYDPANRSKYQVMITDALDFLRHGFVNLYLHYDPKPKGDGKWNRIGLQETEIYDDSFAYALLGIYEHEGWNTTAQRVYNFINTIEASQEHPSYDPAICWAGYIDVVTRSPACDYYDVVTAGILSKIRKNHDKPSLDLSIKTIQENREKFMFWGIRFSDYTHVENKQATVTIAWLLLLFLNCSN